MLTGAKRQVAAMVLGVAALPSSGAEFELADGKLSVKGSAFMGTVIRTDNRAPELLPAANAALIGQAGTGVGGKNQDDGNLNFKRGDPVSSTLKGHLDLEYKGRDYGIVGRAIAWHDYTLESGNRPWGNVPNNFAAGQPLSDSGFAPGSKFSSVMLDDLYLYSRVSLGAGTLNWKIGNQKLDWGNRFTISGGLGDLMPRNLPGSRRAGALPEEGLIPFPALRAELGLLPATTVDVFYQVRFRPNAPHGCGTFFSQFDFASEGCDKAFFGTASDPVSLAGGQYLKRAPTASVSDAGQGGVGVRQQFTSLDADVGVYLTQFHSRSAYFSAAPSLRTGTPFIPADPDGLNAKYFAEYPEHIRMLGLTFGKRLPAGAVLGELTYRPNQPYQYNSIDIVTALVTAAGPTPLRAAVTATAPGAVFRGFERHKAVQLNLGAFYGLAGILGAKATTVAGEFAYKIVPDLPDPAVMRFRRGEVYGQGQVNQACPATSSAKTCSLDGYVSQIAWAYRLRLGLRYPQIVGGVDFMPTLSFGHDVKGWSEDGAILEGRQFAILTLKAEIQKSLVAELSWQPVRGGAYNNLSDRSTVALSLGYRF